MIKSEPGKCRQVDTILVIDDDDNWCYISKRLLSKTKACDKIITAQNGLIAMEKLQALADKGEKMPDNKYRDRIILH